MWDISGKPMQFSLPEQVAMISAFLGANLAIAAILFSALGFLYAVYANLAVPHLPNEADEDMKTPVLPSPVLAVIALISRFILGTLGLSLLIAICCLIWLYCPIKDLFTVIVWGLLGESVALFGLGSYIVIRLIPSIPSIKGLSIDG